MIERKSITVIIQKEALFLSLKKKKVLNFDRIRGIVERLKLQFQTIHLIWDFRDADVFDCRSYKKFIIEETSRKKTFILGNLERAKLTNSIIINSASKADILKLKKTNVNIFFEATTFDKGCSKIAKSNKINFIIRDWRNQKEQYQRNVNLDTGLIFLPLIDFSQIDLNEIETLVNSYVQETYELFLMWLYDSKGQRMPMFEALLKMALEYGSICPSYGMCKQMLLNVSKKIQLFDGSFEYGAPLQYADINEQLVNRIIEHTNLKKETCDICKKSNSFCCLAPIYNPNIVCPELFSILVSELCPLVKAEIDTFQNQKKHLNILNPIAKKIFIDSIVSIQE